MAMGKCIHCRATVTVVDSRPVVTENGERYVRRRYVCDGGHRFSTAERVVIDTDNHRFDHRTEVERLEQVLVSTVAQLQRAIPKRKKREPMAA